MFAKGNQVNLEAHIINLLSAWCFLFFYFIPIFKSAVTSSWKENAACKARVRMCMNVFFVLWSHVRWTPVFRRHQLVTLQRSVMLKGFNGSSFSFDRDRHLPRRSSSFFFRNVFYSCFSSVCAGGLCLWLILWLVVVKPGGVRACPRLCVCYPTPMTVSCQSQNLTIVPAGVPYNSQRVFLQNNRITELRTDSFGFETQVKWQVCSFQRSEFLRLILTSSFSALSV